MSLIFEVIPLIDKFTEKFKTIITDSSLHASLRHVVRMALQVLNKYYSFTDHCDVYWVSICMFLSPDSFIANLQWSAPPLLQNVLLHSSQMASSVDRQGGEPHSRYLDIKIQTNAHLRTSSLLTNSSLSGCQLTSLEEPR